MAAYKADVFLSMAINIIYFYIFFVIWKAIYTSGGITEINNYTLSNTITYYFIITLFFKIDSAGQILLNEWIWYDELTKDLLKPWNIKLVQFIMFAANTIFSLLMYFPFLIILFFALHNYVSLPDLNYLFYFFITVLLSTILGMTFFGIFHSLAFFYGDQDSNISLISYLSAAVAGGFFPLDFLPQKISWIFVHLPFRFMFDMPAKVYLEKLSSGEIFYSWLEMIVWIILFYLIFNYLLKKGLKQFTGVGR